jgi:DNA polymerase elongation subunit (family B)
MDCEDLLRDIKIGELKYYNIYNSDLDLSTHYSVQHYAENSEDNIDIYEQKIHALYTDIEVYKDDPNIDFDFNKADFPVSAVTNYSNIEKKFTLYFLMHRDIKGKFETDPEWYRKQLLEKTVTEMVDGVEVTREYIKPEETLEIKVFDDELKLIETCWDDIRKTDPMVLSGWNSDGFDMPYFYRRLTNFYNNKEDVDSKLSKFGYVNWNNGRVKIPEYGNADLQYFYKPRSEGGLNYGKTLHSYSLDAVATHELKLQKFEYKGTNKNLDDFYTNDPSGYALYNLVDTALLVRLNEKLKHIELHNLLRRMQKAPYTRSMVGNSALFDAYILSKLNGENKKIRHGMSTENSQIFAVDKGDFDEIYQPKTKKGVVKPLDITSKEYREITMKFDGAYVKNSKNIIVNSGLIQDLDATALYPSMMLQSNISFDTYKGRIINPLVYKILEYLGKTMGSDKLNNNMSNTIFDMVKDYIDSSTGFQKKAQAKVQWYYLVNKLLTSLYNSGLKLEQIFKPSNDREAILLSKYLVPFLDIFNTIHPKRKEYNHFVYDYIFDGPENVSKNYPHIYVIKDINSPKMYMEKVSLEDGIDYVSKYSLTITGSLFDKHEDMIGLFTETIDNLLSMRKKYKKEMFKHAKGSEQFNFWNSRQLSVKIAVNSVYGITGLKTFRYSNHNLAQAITTQGRLAIKLAQHLAEQHLQEKYNADAA